MFVLDKTQTQLALATCVLTALFSISSYAQSPAVGSANVATPLTLPSSPMSAATAAEIQKINENMTLLQAQLNELELKAKIVTKQREITTQAKTQDGSAALVVSSFASKSGNPSVVSVAGLKGSLEAVLVFPGGVTQRVKTGDVIDDRRVSKIAVNEVVLTDLKGKNVQRLAFGNSATVREALPSGPGNPYATAPLPPGMPAMPPR
jgi:type IV pilus biogenesis protein PilP